MKILTINGQKEHLETLTDKLVNYFPFLQIVNVPDKKAVQKIKNEKPNIIISPSSDKIIIIFENLIMDNILIPSVFIINYFHFNVLKRLALITKSIPFSFISQLDIEEIYKIINYIQNQIKQKK